MTILREYQRDAVRGVLEQWGNGIRAVCLVAPTGAGKTRIGEEIVSGGERTLWVAHRREIVSQTAKRLIERFGASAVGVVMPGSEARPLARIQVGTVQTLLARPVNPESVQTIVLDEAHHYAGTEWAALREKYARARALGLTATPERRDGTPLGDVFGGLVVAARHTQLLADGVLVGAKVFRPRRRLGSDLAQDPIAAWMAHSEGLPTFVSCARVDIARSLASRFRDAGVLAAAISATTPRVERDDLMAKFRDGALTVLTNVDVLTEGVDVPHAACAVLARGFGHVGAYLQTVGRVIRSAPGKTGAIVIDLCGATHRHGLPTEDRTYSLEGRPISSSAPPPEADEGAAGYTFTQTVVGEALELAIPYKTNSNTRVSPASILKARRAEYENLLQQATTYKLGKGYADLKYQALYGEWPPSTWKKSANQ